MDTYGVHGPQFEPLRAGVLNRG